jgi:arylsulfatase A-like enzyme
LTHWYFRRERGLARGFHTWDTSLVDDDLETGREESAPRVTERARRLLARSKDAKKPFFLWAHYFEPHHFYILHKDTPTFGTAMMDKYDHEIRFVDREVGRLLKHVDDLGLEKTTAVILTSDHGEAFGEHAKYWHGHALYDEQLRVPLIIRAPTSTVPPHPSEALVSLVDLRPTIADFAGVKPIGPVAGRSLVPALRGDALLPPRAIFAEILPQPNYAAHQRMVLRGSWKLIEDIRMRSVELYDLATDTRELKNEATRSRNIVDQLRMSPAALNGTHP